MLTLSQKKARIDFVSHFAKKRFWSTTDTEYIRREIFNFIDSVSSQIIEVNLSGIRDFDPLFGEDIFAGLIKYTKEKFKGNKAVIFSGLQHDMLYYFSYALQKKKQWSVIAHHNDIELIGDVPYIYRVLFRKLFYYSPIVIDVVCEEIGEHKDICISHLDAFINMGLAIKCYGTRENNIYVGIVRRRDVFGLLRYLIKRLKVFLHIKPIYQICHKEKYISKEDV